MTPIYHLTTKTTWQDALQHEHLQHPSLDTEGFIHASTHAQLCATANRYYAGCDELLAIAINPESIADILKYEAPSPPSPETNDLLFPHIYGPIPHNAILGAYPMSTLPDGSFDLPPNLPS